MFVNNLSTHTGLTIRKGRGGKLYKLSERAKTGDIGVLKRTNCYAILTENGFYSNEKERNLMKTDSFITKVAYAHYVSLCSIEQIKPENITKFYE